jgi:2-keto-3-deoxy-6-phosphogluconate aldolase
MTSGPNPLHFLSSRSSTLVSGFSWRRFRADIIDLAHKCVALLMVYATAVGTMPVRAEESFRNTAGIALASSAMTMTKTTPAITWATPAAITYGTALSSKQLDATASVAGTFVYSPAAGTVLAAGTQKLSVTFTPTNTTEYNTATDTVSLNVNKATPVITWATPAAISYGTALSATQLDATANVAGTFVYSPAAGTVLAPGTQKLSVTFTPTNTTDYCTATATVSLTVNKTTPVITWATPAAITYGTALGATQLDATANVAGTFVYSPASNTVLAAGKQTLSVTFTPSNTTDYATTTATVTLTVNVAIPVISWATPAAITYGTALSTTQLDATASVAGTFV